MRTWLAAALCLVAATSASTQRDAPFRPGNGVSFPRVVRDVRPNYTSEAIRAKIQGKVVLECVVGNDGRVNDARIIKSLDAKYGLDDEAVKAAKQWMFEPGRKEGKPVAVLVTIEMAFALVK